MSTKLEDMESRACGAAFRALTELKRDGVQVVVTCTLRTADEQSALFAQGRKCLEEVNALRKKAGMYEIKPYLGKDKKLHSDNDYTVTNCNGIEKSKGGTGRSIHQLGKAIDVVPDMDESEKSVPGWPAPSDPRWQEIAAAFKKQAFEWGGDWKDFPDYPHFQYKG